MMSPLAAFFGCVSVMFLHNPVQILVLILPFSAHYDHWSCVHFGSERDRRRRWWRRLAARRRRSAEAAAAAVVAVSSAVVTAASETSSGDGGVLPPPSPPLIHLLKLEFLEFSQLDFIVSISLHLSFYSHSIEALALVAIYW